MSAGDLRVLVLRNDHVGDGDFPSKSNNSRVMVF